MSKQTVLRKTILDCDIDTFNGDDAFVKAVQEGAKAANAEETSGRNSFPLRPSSALKGERDLYYGLVNFYESNKIPVTPIEGRNSMLLALGHVIEKHVVDAIRRKFEVTHTAQRVDYGTITKKSGEVIILSGEIDLIFKEGERLILGDSKSSADFPFKKSDLPKDEHIAQLNLYMNSQWCKDNGINQARVIYYNKNNSEMKTQDFYFDQHLANKTIARFQKVHNMYEAGTIPAREHVLGLDWQASYSNFRDYDWSEFEAPMHTREVIEGAAPLMGSLKDKLGFLIKKYGTKIVHTTDGSVAYAEKVGAAMMLRLEDSEGFSS